jgi:steroid 5-alpha reductase family enzyme
MNFFLETGLVLFLYMNLWFMIAVAGKRNDVADIAWGPGFAVLAWSASVIAGTWTTPALLANSLVSVWGIRLAWHIFRRNRNKGEDFRYLEWRKAWGKWFYPRSYFQVFILQGVLLFIIALPVLFINKNSGTTLDWIDVAGILVWCTGFFFETIADRQLAGFVKQPMNKGKIMQTGLWRYSRHPNYFGEVVQWWGIFLIALSLPGGWMTIPGPVTITLLILFVSGVPMLEKKYAGRPEWEEYRRTTSIFLPLPPVK